MESKLPELNYSYDSLEPFIDAKTMEIHYTKHHQTYLDKLKIALESFPELNKKSAEELVKDLNSLPEQVKSAVRNHGGGFINHNFFWRILKKETRFDGIIVEAINEKFGSLEDFKKQFKEAALSLFGSGWVWLVLNNKNLEIIKTQNQDSPLSENKLPIIGLDLWEHAYYLKYQNKRPDYVDAFFNIINWEEINKIYDSAIK